MTFTEKNFLYRKATEYSVWNFYPDSLIREPIQRYSVCAS